MLPAKLRVALLILALAIGASLYHGASVRNGPEPYAAAVAIAAGLLVAVRPTRNALATLHLRVESLGPAGYAAFVFASAVATFGWFWHRATTAVYALYPYLHDEYMTLLQARMLAAGHFALPSHALPDFFDTFYVLVRPVYAAMYFPGTALAYVPSLWLGLPVYVWPMLICTAAMVLVQLLAARILDSRLLGVAAAVAVISTWPMGYLPTMTMSHPLATAQGAGVLLAWLSWRERPRAWVAAVAGALAGWMAITRPAESIAYCLPVAIAVAAKLLTLPRREAARHAGLAVAAGLPFLVLLAAQNAAVTGSPFRLPINEYVRQEFVGADTIADPRFGPSAFKSASTLPQKRAMFEQFVAPARVEHATKSLFEIAQAREEMILDYAVSNTPFCLLLPLALVRLGDPKIRVILSIAALFFGVYLLYSDFQQQYAIQVAPLLAIMIVTGAALLRAQFPRRSHAIAFAYAIMMVVFAVGFSPKLPRASYSPGRIGKMLREVYLTLPVEIQGRALVLVKFTPGESPYNEPVYNLSAARIDDNRIVLAHDLGPDRNGEIVRYYAERQPDRELYLFDRSTLKLTDEGNVRELADRMAEDAKARGGAATAPATP